MKARKRIIEIIAKEASIHEEFIRLNSCLEDNLGFNLRDRYKLLMAIENEYGIEIPNKTIEGFKTVGDIVKYIKTKKESDA